ncbi:MAG: undecaprenyl-phosphate glucose phosphotransferase [Candidatus Omnitrophica bacterium]|nr:undecaprenyl-phosphate glucose phosphotransferase [Candidatus Omnitrophota bacterium]
MILPKRRKRESFLPWIHVLLDYAVIIVFLRGVFWFRFTSGFFENVIPVSNYPYYFRSFNFIALVVLFFLRFYDLYKVGRGLTFSAETAKIFKAVAASAILLMAITFFIRGFSYSRTFLSIACSLIGIGLAVERYVFGIFLMGIDEKRGSLRNILVVGCNENARRLVRYYRENPRFGARVVGFLDDTLPKDSRTEETPVLGRTRELGGLIQTRRDIHEVVLSLPKASSEEVLRMICECEKEMVAFRWIADIFGLITSKMTVSYFGVVPVLSFTDSPLADWENRALKRAMDMALSFSALIFLSPFVAAIALWIKKDSPGPVFYKQERVGQDGRRFMLFKFRTMKLGAESQTGPVWAAKDDPRRTRLGAFLRKNNLDELPQLWNVLKGDMSLVGPRPERPFFVSQFKEDIPRYMARHSIRSGITGWAQVNGLRGNTSIEERTKFDLYYIENWSIFFDIKILFLTALARKNAY